MLGYTPGDTCQHYVHGDPSLPFAIVHDDHGGPSPRSRKESHCSKKSMFHMYKEMRYYAAKDTSLLDV
jgi:hypothetical protein